MKDKSKLTRSLTHPAQAYCINPIGHGLRVCTNASSEHCDHLAQQRLIVHIDHARIEHSSQQGGTSSGSKQQSRPEKQAELPRHKVRSNYGHWDKFDVDAALAEASDGEADSQAQLASQHQRQQASTSRPSAPGTRNGSVEAETFKRTEGVSHASGLSARHTIKRPKPAHVPAKQVLICFLTFMSSLGLATHAHPWT